VPRDCLLTRHDINNVRAQIDNDQWKLDSDAAQSVRMFTQQRAKDVKGYQVRL
jgi:hypothetical protein